MSPKPTALLREKDPRANPFEFAGGPDAALLVHGFTGTCAEMLPLGELLSKEFGWHVTCPLLPGHGTTIWHLEQTTWNQWVDAVEESWVALAKKHERIHLVGLSMGSLLCLELFRRHPKAFQSLALLVPAVWLRTWLQTFASLLVRSPILYKIVPAVSKATPNHADHVAYDKYPPRATGEFSRAFSRAQTLKKMEAPPTLIVYSDADEVVHPRSAPFLADRLINPLSRVVRLTKSSHVVTIGSEKEKLLEEVRTFYREILPDTQPTRPKP